MEIEDIVAPLTAFIRSHNTEFNEIARKQSQVLELGAAVYVISHYSNKGYSVEPKNLIRGSFRVKYSSSGKPWNFSWFEISNGDISFEVHLNLTVFGAYPDNATYVVDVGVIENGVLPEGNARKHWRAIDNSFLVSLVEVKSMVVYPMLLAQFIGIVHEILPSFLSNQEPNQFSIRGHFYPSLFARGYIHGTCGNILSGFANRGYKVSVVDSIDFKISQVRSGQVVEIVGVG